MRISTPLCTIIGLALTMMSTPALADSAYGVRVHRLIPVDQAPVSQEKTDRKHVAQHSHDVTIHRPARVTVTFRAAGIGRPQQPGALRPWREKRTHGRRLYQNPRHLYRSELYRNGFQ
ncbi:MAG: hypothetical protein AAFZ01_04355 [Pseudomonadota bacterium]